mmetsp:Transcript_92520/g.283271  ORF Transcript_92520/g.283271 Transcript_92520/m.283271 type:complete len:249 (+) Transcript_92520:1113-1859(+)
MPDVNQWYGEGSPRTADNIDHEVDMRPRWKTERDHDHQDFAPGQDAEYVRHTMLRCYVQSQHNACQKSENNDEHTGKQRASDPTTNRGDSGEDNLLKLDGQEGLVDTPNTSVNADFPRWHHHNVRCRLQRLRERRRTRLCDKRVDVERLRVRQNATPGCLLPVWPRCQHFVNEFIDALLPTMSDKDVTRQTIGMSQQRPTHVPGLLGQRLDVLLYDGVHVRSHHVVVDIEHVQLQRLDTLLSDHLLYL